MYTNCMCVYVVWDQQQWRQQWPTWMIHMPKLLFTSFAVDLFFIATVQRLLNVVSFFSITHLLTLYRRCRIFQFHLWWAHNIVAVPLHRLYSNRAQIASKSLEPVIKWRKVFSFVLFSKNGFNETVQFCWFCRTQSHLPCPCLATELEYLLHHCDYYAIDLEPSIDLHSRINYQHLLPTFVWFGNFHLKHSNHRLITIHFKLWCVFISFFIKTLYRYKFQL